MPKPAYFICSRTGALDPYSDSVSAIEIVETIKIRKRENGFIKLVGPASMRVVAAWMREENDSIDTPFETQIVAYAPAQEAIKMEARFPAFFFHDSVCRFILPDVSLEYFPLQKGTFRLECLLRRQSEPSWAQKQECLICVEEMPTADGFLGTWKGTNKVDPSLTNVLTISQSDDGNVVIHQEFFEKDGLLAGESGGTQVGYNEDGKIIYKNVMHKPPRPGWGDAVVTLSLKGDEMLSVWREGPISGGFETLRRVADSELSALNRLAKAAAKDAKESL